MNPKALWETWTLAKQWGVRPSELLSIAYELDAYFLDRAITTFGMSVEADLDKASTDAKNSKKAAQARARVLDKWLETETRYRDPMAGQGPPAAQVKKEPGGGGQQPVSSQMNGPVVL